MSKKKITQKEVEHLIIAALCEEKGIYEEELYRMLADKGAQESQIMSTLRALKNTGKILPREDQTTKRTYWEPSKGVYQRYQRAKQPPPLVVGGYYKGRVKLRFLMPSLAGGMNAHPNGGFNNGAEQEDDGEGDEEAPKSQASSVSYLGFERNGEGRIVLLPHHFKGLMRVAMQTLLGDRNRKWYSNYMHFESVTLPAEFKVGQFRSSVKPEREGQQGRGINVYETLPAGTEISVTFLFPASHLPSAMGETLWRTAGITGFSTGKARFGYGQFEVLEYEELPVHLDMPAEEPAAAGSNN